jgi:hypothetical protein
MTQSIMAIDVDLCRVHAYSNQRGRICYNAPEWPWEAITAHDVVLVEVASPVDTSRATKDDEGNEVQGADAQAYNRRKWMIGNAYMLGRLAMWMEYRKATCPQILVSSADQWTLKHKGPVREVIAGCSGQDNHDIRACRCMLFFQHTNPDKWKPLDQFLQALRKPQAASSKKSKSRA